MGLAFDHDATPIVHRFRCASSVYLTLTGQITHCAKFAKIRRRTPKCACASLKFGSALSYRRDVRRSDLS